MKKLNYLKPNKKRLKTKPIHALFTLFQKNLQKNSPEKISKPIKIEKEVTVESKKEIQSFEISPLQTD